MLNTYCKQTKGRRKINHNYTKTLQEIMVVLYI